MTSPPVARKAAEKKRTVKQTDRHRNWKFDEEAAYAEALSWVGEQLEARYVDPPAPPEMLLTPPKRDQAHHMGAMDNRGQ